VGARLGVAKQNFFGLPGQYGRRVTRANAVRTGAMAPGGDNNVVMATNIYSYYFTSLKMNFLNE